MAKWSVSHLGPDVHVVKVQLEGREDYFDAFLSSDWHIDHPKCDRQTLLGDLKTARQLNAAVFAFGDTLCLMQSKRDPRATKGMTRPAHDREDYFNAVCEEVAEVLQPYGEQLALFTYGNHESNVVDRHGFDVLRMLSDRLKVEGAPHVGVGGYAGYVRFQFDRAGQKQGHRDLFYHHGFGRGAPATRGTLKVNYRQLMADGDLYYDGHDHHRWVMPIETQRLSAQSVVHSVGKLHVHGGSYKVEGGISKGFYNWDVEKAGSGRRPLGGWFVRFWQDREAGIRFGPLDRDLPGLGGG